MKNLQPALVSLSRAVGRPLGGFLTLACLASLWPRSAAAQPVPQSSLAAPATALLGESWNVRLTFDNTGSAEGFAPFLDLVLPVNGSDGSAGVGVDGLSLSTVDHLGTAVPFVTLTFPNDGDGSGCVAHPLAVDSANHPLQVCGPTGDQLVSFDLPFGSFVGDQPAAVFDLNLDISPNADRGSP